MRHAHKSVFQYCTCKESSMIKYKLKHTKQWQKRAINSFVRGLVHSRRQRECGNVRGHGFFRCNTSRRNTRWIYELCCFTHVAVIWVSYMRRRVFWLRFVENSGRLSLVDNRGKVAAPTWKGHTAISAISHCVCNAAMFHLVLFFFFFNCYSQRFFRLLYWMCI